MRCQSNCLSIPAWRWWRWRNQGQTETE